MYDSPIQEIVCCIGQPVAGNPSQFMMEQAFAAAGIDWRYLTLEVAPERLGDAIRGMRAMGFRGGHLAPPHKAAVLDFMDHLTDAARLIGAVNCVTIRGDEFHGENTEGKAFIESLSGLTTPAGKHAVIFGAGGVARAIAIELALGGAEAITIVNRSVERGEALAQLLSEQAGTTTTRYDRWDSEYAIPENADLVINATSLGEGDSQARLPVVSDSLQPQQIVADVVYNPVRTWFLQRAAERGCKTVDGLGMLVNQIAIAFQNWTSMQPDKAVMREAVEEFLEV